MDNFYPHPKSEGIFALIGQKRIALYDAYKEVQICLVNFQDPIAQAKFLYQSEFEQLISIADILQKNYGQSHAPVPKQEIAITRGDQRHLKPQHFFPQEYLWVVQSTGKFCLIELENYKVVFESTFLQAFQLGNLIKEKYGHAPDLVTVRTQNIRADLVANSQNVIINYNTNSLVNVALELGSKKYCQLPYFVQARRRLPQHPRAADHLPHDEAL